MSTGVTVIDDFANLHVPWGNAEDPSISFISMYDTSTLAADTNQVTLL